MNQAILIKSYRLGLALLIITAIVIQLLTVRQTLINFFSYFTVLSNLLTAYILIVVSLSQSARRFLDVLRGASTVYLLTTGLGFILLLDGNKEFLLGWVNGVFHYLAPIILLLDWIYFPSSKISFKNVLSWAIFPFIYLLYSLTRGRITGWYPYSFLNLSEVGYGEVLYAGLITVYCLTIVWYLANPKRS